MTHVINQPVQVNAFYFAGQQMKTFPKQIEYAGQAITFMNGLRYLVQQGTHAIRLFEMSASDGLTYRLQQTDSSWTLLGTKGIA